MSHKPALKKLMIPWSNVTGVTIKDIVHARHLPVINKNQDGKDPVLIPNNGSITVPSQPDSESEHPAQTQTQTPKPLPRIEFLDIRGCTGVSLEAVEFGRKYGLRIVDF
jgi:hypothetical protein